MIQKNGHNDDIGWVVGGLFKMIGYSFIGVLHLILNPIKCIVDIIILLIIFFILYERMKITGGNNANWIDLIILVVFFKYLARVGEKGSIVG